MIPDYQTLMRPVLECASQGEVRISTVIDELAEKFHLTDVEREELLPSGKRSRFANRVHWATRRIPDLAPAGIEAKLTTKLAEWWGLPDFAAFRAEVKKALKADIPLAERSDWEDWIARVKAKIARLTAQIKANEDQINSIVYDLFDLTEDETNLLEANI